MAWFPEIREPQPGDGVVRSILWPFVFAPLGFVALIHIGTRMAWMLGWR